MKTTALLSLVALVACAQQDLAWFKTGATQQDFVQARARCNMGVANVPPGTDSWDTINRQQAYFNNCMVADGWELRRR